MAREMTPQELAAVYKYHRVFDGYNFLSGPKGMEEIITHDMELVNIEDHEAAIQETRRAALLEAVEFLKLMPMLTKDNAIAVLTRLAQEG